MVLTLGAEAEVVLVGLDAGARSERDDKLEMEVVGARSMAARFIRGAYVLSQYNMHRTTVLTMVGAPRLRTPVTLARRLTPTFWSPFESGGASFE
jgi:hypothetical protein